MNCFSCSKDIKNLINCDKCSSKFCSDSCLAFHYIFYHNEEDDNNNKEKEFIIQIMISIMYIIFIHLILQRVFFWKK